MIMVFFLSAILGVGLIVPGWLRLRKQRPLNFSILGLPIAGMAVWVVLITHGVGAQSLSNLIEVPILVVASVAIAYLIFWYSRHHFNRLTHGVIIGYSAIVLLVFALRLLMPDLPE